MSKEEFSIKVGDKVIANDEFHWSGFIDGEVIEIIPYKDGSRMSNEPSFNDNKFGVTILGRFARMQNVISGESYGEQYEYTRRIYSCDIKINPIFDVNIEWSCYGSYAKAIFFTSQKIKDDFNEMIRKKNMEYHLRMAQSYGYKIENQNKNKDDN